MRLNLVKPWEILNFLYKNVRSEINIVYYSKCHICEKQIWIEYITALTILGFKVPHYMRHFEEELV